MILGFNLHKFDDRQGFAALVGVALFLLALVFGGVLLFASIWMLALHMHPHQVLWGWLSTKQTDRYGHTHWRVGDIPIYYGFGVLNAYLFYQLCELFAWGYRLLWRVAARDSAV